MDRKNPTSVPADKIAAARQRAEQTRRQLQHQPGPAELLTPQERDDAAPFYFVLRDYIRQLKEAREAAGMTLAEVSARSGLAVESLSRLETGAQTNPTWKTLGLYALAVGRRPRLTAEPADSGSAPAPTSAQTAARQIVAGETARTNTLPPPHRMIATNSALPGIVWHGAPANPRYTVTSLTYPAPAGV